VPLLSSDVSVAATPTKLAAGGSSSNDKASVLVYNNGAVTLYVGGAAVTTGTGVPVAAAASFTVDLGPGDDLYAVVASGTCDARVIRSRS
jgi:hypothetical protein